MNLLLRFIDATFRFRRLVVFLVHVLITIVSAAVAYGLRFGFETPHYSSELVQFTLLALVIKLSVFHLWQLNHGWWRYTSISDVRRIVAASALASSLLWILGSFFQPFHSRSVLVLDLMLTIGMKTGIRLFIRMLRESQIRPAFVRRHSDKRVFIIGAGDAGLALLRSLQNNININIYLVGLIDDSRKKQGIRLYDVPVLGTTHDLPALVRLHGVNEIYIAIPSAQKGELERIVNRCLEAKVPFKTIPSLQEMIEQGSRVDQLREVRVEDLLGRQAIRLDKSKTAEEIQGRSVMITGAGGSIGSELCRQILEFRPAKLILFERSEENLFYIERELLEKFPGVRLVPVIGDILDFVSLESTMKLHQPTLVYHAAAYKHVSLMQLNARESIKNNIFGTATLVQALIQFGAEKLVMISTDKAVNPKSTMGYSKRMAELVCQTRAHEGCQIISVRFGNVLGSSGSVVEIFRSQIAAGRPLTVTDPDATRFFMTAHEAVELVLHAGTFGKTGDIYMLDMGRPAKIDQLARRMIELADPVGTRDLRIVYTGLRDGEKLSEELVWSGEDFVPSGVEKVFTMRNLVNLEEVPRVIETLRQAIQSSSADCAGVLRASVDQIDRAITPNRSPLSHRSSAVLSREEPMLEQVSG